MGRPKKPVELKKLEGTYRKDRDSKTEKTHNILVQTKQVLFSKTEKINCPQSIKSEYVKSFWKDLTNTLISIQELSPIDIPQVEQLCVVLEKLIEVQNIWTELSPLDESFEQVQKLYLSLSNKFDALGSKFFITPQARAKLTLDVLNVTKTKQDIEKNDNAINNLLSHRL